MPKLSDEATRFRRRLRPGSNPLVRSWDRIEAWLLLLVVAGTLVSVPFAVVAGTESYAAQLATASDRRPANAVTLAEAPRPVVGSDGAQPIGSFTVAAKWFDSRGVMHQGEVLPAPGSPAGTSVPIWLDNRGESVLPPVTSGAAIFGSLFLAAWVWFVPTALLLLVYRLGRRLLDRRRATDWDRAWAEYAGHSSTS